MSNEVFALDIGTRTVAGLILASSDDGFELKEAVVEQQLPGAMADANRLRNYAPSQGPPDELRRSKGLRA
jgi:hypothetical protein